MDGKVTSPFKVPSSLPRYKESSRWTTDCLERFATPIDSWNYWEEISFSGGPEGFLSILDTSLTEWTRKIEIPKILSRMGKITIVIVELRRGLYLFFRIKRYYPTRNLYAAAHVSLFGFNPKDPS